MTPRRFFAPEVLQTSLMDCGPAALQAVLEGFGIGSSYEALRERCQTDVDGTSIDALAALAADLGLASHRVVAPRDHFLLPEADCLPAIVVTRSGGGLLHFLVVWRTLGRWVQVMDPSGGRRWVEKEAFLERMPDLDLPMAERTWRRWASTDNAVAPLRARMRAAGLRWPAIEQLVADGRRDPTWRTLGALDAGVRMITALRDADAIEPGEPAERLLDSLLARSLDPAAPPDDGIPRRFWWVSAASAKGQLTVHGAVIVHFSGRRRDAGARDAGAPSQDPVVALRTQPLRLVLATVVRDAPHAIGLLAVALAASVAVTALDVLLARGAIDLGRFLALDYQRASGLLALAVFAAAGLGLELFLAALIHRMGRGLETRLRVALLEKIPRLEDRYLRSRPTSDMASRGHQLQILREVPALFARLVRASSGLLVTTAAIALLQPRALGWALGAALLSVVLPLAVQRPLAETSLRLRTQGAALDRFYLDALLGVSPIRIHGAERAVSREHEALLTDWARTGRTIQAQSARLSAVQLCAGTLVAVLLVVGYVTADRPLGALLLVAFWAFRIPAAGQELVFALASYRDLRNVATRLFAPLGAAESAIGEAGPAPVPGQGGVRVDIVDVTVRPAGSTILRDVSTTIASGSHVAIVGASGSGKSSLVGLLLGWLTPAAGRVLVDGEPLDGRRVARLRRELAWADPAVQLWNRSLLDNVVFGDDDAPLARLPDAIRGADLGEVLEVLPSGLQAELGEGGVGISGGQGQRVRLARALLRKAPRLVILDEPFRGLERPRRRELLARARARFHASTLLFVSHDVSDTRGLDRVIVMHEGRIVEDGAPATLLADPHSRYRALVAADAAVRSATWSSKRWRRLTVERGGIVPTRDER